MTVIILLPKKTFLLFCFSSSSLTATFVGSRKLDRLDRFSFFDGAQFRGKKARKEQKYFHIFVLFFRERQTS